MKTNTSMRFRFFLLATLTAATNLYAQDTLVPVHESVYVVKLKLLNGHVINGYLKTVTDSTVVYNLLPVIVGSSAQDSDHAVDMAKLAMIKFRKKGAPGRGALIGAVVGIGIGAGIGFASGDDPPDQWFSFTAGEKAASLALLGVVLGTPIGAIIGSNSETFQIDGKKENFRALQQAVYEKFYRKTSPAVNP
ncbi:MAG TPA: hypothetical protein VFL47_16310 [Flavisolibacter sp.]|nr:hypothetical protein [Flavisolibacter sp.]